MSLSDAKEVTVLEVEGPLGVPIQVMDGKLRTIATGAGRLSAALPQGIYTVRWSGSEPEERTVRLFASPRPTIVKGGGSAQEFGAIALSGGGLLETMGSQNPSAGSPRPSRPRPATTLCIVVETDEEVMVKSDAARSLRILDARRREVARWSEQTKRSRGRLEAALPPGTYVLVFRSTGGRLVEQSVVITPGFQTVVRLANERGYEFRGREGYRKLTAIRGVDPARTVILSVPLGRPSLPDHDMSRAQTLLRSLYARRTLLDELLLDLSASDQDPYVQLYCALVIGKALREDPNANGWATGIAERIADALPREFESDAVGLRCGLGRADPLQRHDRLSAPPMLAVSWRWLTERTLSAPGVIVRNELMEAASDAPSAFLPWLVWYSSAVRKLEARRPGMPVFPEQELRRLIEQILAETSSTRFLEQGSFGLATRLSGRDDLSSLLKPDTSRFLSDLGHLWNAHSVQAVSELAGDLGLPAGNLLDRAEETLEELRSKRGAAV